MIICWFCSKSEHWHRKVRFLERNKGHIEKSSWDLICCKESLEAVGELIWHLEPSWNQIRAFEALGKRQNVNIFVVFSNFGMYPDSNFLKFWLEISTNRFFTENWKTYCLRASASETIPSISWSFCKRVKKAVIYSFWRKKAKSVWQAIERSCSVETWKRTKYSTLTWEAHTVDTEYVCQTWVNLRGKSYTKT